MQQELLPEDYERICEAVAASVLDAINQRLDQNDFVPIGQRPDWATVTVREGAAIHGRSPPTIWRWIAEGKLTKPTLIGCKSHWTVKQLREDRERLDQEANSEGLT